MVPYDYPKLRQLEEALASSNARLAHRNVACSRTWKVGEYSIVVSDIAGLMQCQVWPEVSNTPLLEFRHSDPARIVGALVGAGFVQCGDDGDGGDSSGAGRRQACRHTGGALLCGPPRGQEGLFLPYRHL